MNLSTIVVNSQRLISLIARGQFRTLEGNSAYLVSILSWDPPASCLVQHLPWHSCVTFACLCLRPQLGKSFSRSKTLRIWIFSSTKEPCAISGGEARALSSLRLSWPFGIRFEYVLMICDMFRALRIGFPFDSAPSIRLSLFYRKCLIHGALDRVCTTARERQLETEREWERERERVLELLLVCVGFDCQTHK